MLREKFLQTLDKLYYEVVSNTYCVCKHMRIIMWNTYAGMCQYLDMPLATLLGIFKDLRVYLPV